jgi:hypothetical protein
LAGSPLGIFLLVLQDLGNVPTFANVLALDIPDYHTRVQGVMDSTGGCHVHLGRLDLGLFRIVKSWFLQCTEIQCFQFGNIADHFLVQRIDFGEVRNIFIRQKGFGRLEELNNYVIKL